MFNNIVTQSPQANQTAKSDDTTNNEARLEMQQ
jgi:hypothetical protein